MERNIADYFEEYIGGLVDRNKLAKKEGFKMGRCRGLYDLEPFLNKMRSGDAFVLVGETIPTAIVNENGGFFERKVFTIFILKRYERAKEDEFKESTNICLELAKQMYSRMLAGIDDLVNKEVYLREEKLVMKTFEKELYPGAAGLYFLIELDEATDMRFDESKWNE